MIPVITDIRWLAISTMLRIVAWAAPRNAALFKIKIAGLQTHIAINRQSDRMDRKIRELEQI